MLLYHGSKSGIHGDIKPQSRSACDFGAGFYMGDKPEQPKGLIASYPDHIFYEIDYDITDLKIKSFGDGYIDRLIGLYLLLITDSRKNLLSLNRYV